jgi:site-specific DNA-methyltransferase (adenine-specific)
MKLIPLNCIEVKNRQRAAIATGPLNDLKESILGRGLLNPPVCWYNVQDGSWTLVAGERRLRAIQEINKEKREFYCGDSPVPIGSIPVTPLGDYLSEVGRFEAELDENVQRVDLEWPDKMKAYAALHEMRKLQNPQQTISQTAQELSQRTQQTEAHSQRLIGQASVIAKHLDNPKIAMARNPSEALTLIYKQEEEKIMAALIKRQIAAMPHKPEIEIRHADLKTLLPLLPDSTYDLILSDPPYGIDASGAGFRARSVHHHNYKDNAPAARELAQTILAEGFRIAKPRANIFIFCDIDLFPWLKTTGSNLGWEPFRRPLIWMKSESEGLAPWGGQGPRITTEFIFYATKGQRGLNASPVDVFDERRVSRTERIHAAEKPVSLFERLINCSCLPGDVVLDPCCGSGASLVACKNLQRRALGIEIDEDYYNAALTNVFGLKP